MTSPVTAQISSVLARRELRYFYSADITGFWRHRPDILTGIIIGAPMRSVRYFDFPKKRRGKKVSQSDLSTQRSGGERCVERSEERRVVVLNVA